MIIRLTLTAMFFSLTSGVNVFAQAKQSGMDMDKYSEYAGMITILMVIVMFVIFLLLVDRKPEAAAGLVEARAVQPSLFKRFRQYVTRAVEIEREEDIMFDHDFDGIRELDNKIPPWFSAIFYGTMVFALIICLTSTCSVRGNL